MTETSDQLTDYYNPEDKKAKITKILKHFSKKKKLDRLDKKLLISTLTNSIKTIRKEEKEEAQTDFEASTNNIPPKLMSQITKYFKKSITF